MAEGEEPPKGFARSEGEEPPKGFARTEDEPPKGFVRAEDEPPKGFARDGSEGVFGGGLGWAIVAFIGPVGLDVSQLAARMLRGGGQGRSFRQQPLGDLARVQREARRQVAAGQGQSQSARPRRRVVKTAAAGKRSPRTRKGGRRPKYRT